MEDKNCQNTIIVKPLKVGFYMRNNINNKWTSDSKTKWLRENK